jgi:hypothetical protein
MRFAELVEIVLSVLAALGGGAAIVGAFSNWLGRVWADRLMEKERARYQRELEEIKAHGRAGPGTRESEISAGSPGV